MKLDKIATDFEKFVHDGSTIASAIGLIGGSKEEPLWVQGGNLQEDNVLAEAATNPCSSLQEFKDNIKQLDAELLQVLPTGYSLVTKATNVYTREFLMNCGSNALRFGCSAEVQAWTGEVIIAPSPYTELRSAGAHVHFSYENPTESTTRTIIQMMDYLLGAWSVVHDPDRERRQLYGTAGSCRIKEYGGEYRALSNFWIDNDALIEEVYNRTKCAVENAHNIGVCLAVLTPSQLRTAINEYDYNTCLRVEQEIKSIFSL